MKYYVAVIYDRMNVIVRVEERPSRERAEMAGKFWTKCAGWFKVVEGDEDLVGMYKAMINM